MADKATGAWTTEEERLIRESWARGQSAREIMDILPGRSRNAILGKVHRMGLPNRKPTAPPSKKSAKVKKGEPVFAPVFEPAGPRRSLMELERHQCRWPFGDPKHDDFGFCGAPCRGGEIYCAAHRQRAVNPAARRTDLEKTLAKSLLAWGV